MRLFYYNPATGRKYDVREIVEYCNSSGLLVVRIRVRGLHASPWVVRASHLFIEEK